jgi:IMP cyclohydrolase
MDTEKDELVELSREIKKIISENKKFLDRVMDDEFEPDEETEEDEAGTVVEL